MRCREGGLGVLGGGGCDEVLDGGFGDVVLALSFDEFLLITSSLLPEIRSIMMGAALMLLIHFC